MRGTGMEEGSLAPPPRAPRRRAMTAPGSAAPHRRGPIATVRAIGRSALQPTIDARFADELRAAQHDAILHRTVILIWISVVVVPLTN